MTTDPASRIEYATDRLELPADRLLRRIVAGAAIVYGGLALAESALYLALDGGLMARPPNRPMGNVGSGLYQAVAAARLLAMAASVAGGVLVLGRSPSGVRVVRAAAACSVALLVLGTAMHLRNRPAYWSTPDVAVALATHHVRGLMVPVLIVLLTLPPLARRMR